MTVKFRVFASMHLAILPGNPNTSCVSYTVSAENAFDALGNANAAARRMGIDIKSFKYFEITEINTND